MSISLSWLWIKVVDWINGSCHCGACQAMTSSAFSIGLVVPAESFELSDAEGLLRIYEDSDPFTLASNRIAFCGKCGCYLMHEPVIFLCLPRTILLSIEKRQLQSLQVIQDMSNCSFVSLCFDCDIFCICYGD